MSGRQSSPTILLFLPGSSQADRSTPSPIKLSLDRPELGSNPHRSPPLSAAHHGFRAYTQKKKPLRALARPPRTAIPQNKTIVYGRALASRLLKKSLRFRKREIRRGIFRLGRVDREECASGLNHFHFLFTPLGTLRLSKPRAWVGEQDRRRQCRRRTRRGLCSAPRCRHKKTMPQSSDLRPASSVERTTPERRAEITKKAAA